MHCELIMDFNLSIEAGDPFSPNLGILFKRKRLKTAVAHIVDEGISNKFIH